ncbi:LysR family transcriptional regulator [Clostridium hydrogeniformans]|uniref:LysR family transcriptional regulator n=1 Tax=Clostridium hydrogeniformans TaxID=349933 RepID=UPI000486359D|nr:LysR family transcriptional regulator [Clostridium hydrogeniformans]
MNIEYLKYFYNIARFRSISKVATDCHISQSALSQQIQKLEQRLGVKLLERSNKGVSLTPQGELILRHCEIIINAYDKMIEDINSSTINNVSLSSYYTLTSFIPEIFINYNKESRDKYNNKIKVNFDNNNTILSKILNDICDIGILYSFVDDKHVACTKIGEDRLVLAASSKLNVKDSLTLDDIFKYPFILLNKRLNIKNNLREALLHEGKNIGDLNTILNLDSFESAKSAILNGYGIGLVPYLSIKNELQRGSIKEIELEGFEYNFDVYMVYKKEFLSKNREFLDELQSHFKLIFNK